MASFNRVICLGNLGADPETRQAGDSPVTTFRIACSEKFKGRDGQQQERTEWITCVAWQRLAEIARDYLRKGSPVLIEGKLQTRSWEDSSTGQKRYATEVRVETLQLIGGRREGEQGGQGGGFTPPSGGSGGYSGSGSGGFPDDNLPF